MFGVKEAGIVNVWERSLHMTRRHEGTGQSFSHYNRYPEWESNLENMQYETGHGFLLVFLSDSLETAK
jgi:hypothetical protein